MSRRRPSSAARRSRPLPPLSRRRFMSMLAAGSAAALAAPVAALASGKTASRPKAMPAAPATKREGAASAVASPKEIEKQKQYVAEALKAIRNYELPPGSDPAFVFRPLRRGRGKRER